MLDRLKSPISCALSAMLVLVFLPSCKKINDNYSPNFENRDVVSNGVSSREISRAELDKKSQDKFSLGRIKLSTGDSVHKLLKIKKDVIAKALTDQLEASPYFDKDGLPVDLDINVAVNEEVVGGPNKEGKAVPPYAENARKSVTTFLFFSQGYLADGITLKDGSRSGAEFLTQEVFETIESVPMQELFDKALENYTSKVKQQVELHLVDINLLHTYLNEPNISVDARVSALQRIALAENQNYLPELKRLLQSPENEVVFWAARTLLILRADQEMPTILEKTQAFATINSRFLKPMLIGLAEHGGPEAIAYLKGYANSEKNPKELREFVKSLLKQSGKMGDANSAPPSTTQTDDD